MFFKILFCLEVIWEKWFYEEETCSELFIFSVFKNNNWVKINKIKTLLCYIFILLLFLEEKVCIYVSNALKWRVFQNEVQWNKFKVSMVLFILFQVLLVVIFYPFLFPTQVIISFLYFVQIKCNCYKFALLMSRIIL